MTCSGPLDHPATPAVLQEISATRILTSVFPGFLTDQCSDNRASTTGGSSLSISVDPRPEQGDPTTVSVSIRPFGGFVFGENNFEGKWEKANRVVPAMQLIIKGKYFCRGTVRASTPWIPLLWIRSVDVLIARTHTGPFRCLHFSLRQ